MKFSFSKDYIRPSTRPSLFKKPNKNERRDQIKNHFRRICDEAQNLKKTTDVAMKSGALIGIIADIISQIGKEVKYWKNNNPEEEVITNTKDLLAINDINYKQLLTFIDNYKKDPKAVKSQELLNVTINNLCNILINIDNSSVTKPTIMNYILDTIELIQKYRV